MALLKFNETQTCTYAIKLWKRDSQGKPTNQYVEFESNDSGDIAGFYERNGYSGIKKRKHVRHNKGNDKQDQNQSQEQGNEQGKVKD
jgi:hypothetical protein